ncbi:MAG: hypothetical protein LBD11_07265 [Candidatus Peribacteria bacterium]|jgi:hypothetical protein|nr:hypothetical protein [Candidatus Peribacteria bacterium]
MAVTEIRWVALEGAMRCPIGEILEIIFETNKALKRLKKPYRYRLRKRIRGYRQLKKQGETPLCGNHVLFIGPQAHKIFGRGNCDIKKFNNTTLHGVKIFVCTTLAGTPKLTKKSFDRSWKEFLNSEQ